MLCPLIGWSGPPAALTMWRPSAATAASARRAPASPVPPSYEQEQHLRAFRDCEQRQDEMARLLIVTWEEPGQCDIAAMTQVVTAHLSRHDTYHSWFAERDGTLVRHVLADPAGIEMEPVALGDVNAAEWREHASATPSPFAWDCFRFGILQRADGFTCFASIDHLNTDASVIPLVMRELHAAYRAVIGGGTLPALPPPGRYLDYCAGQRQRAASLTLTDPAVAEWIAFLHRNKGRMPPFPLPLGVLEDRCRAAYLNLDILDEAATAAFESACRASGGRMIGGLLACAGLTERELAGAARYSVVTLAPTRRSPQAFRTAGWCMGILPIDFDLAGQGFAGLAGIAEQVFEDRLHLAGVPIERVLELAAGLPSIRPVATGGVMLSYSDMSRPPFSPQVLHDWHHTNGRVYFNQGMAAQVAIWLFKTGRGLTLTAAYPDNATAGSSMQRYAETFRTMCRRVAGQPLEARA